MSNALGQLKKMVVFEVSKLIRDYEEDDLAACLHLVYYDTHAPCCYVDLMVTTASKRTELYAEDPSDYWDGWGEPGNVNLGQIKGPIMDSVYEFLSEDGREEENMKAYRDCLASCAMTVNQALPKGLPNVTDDFVVVLGDGSRWTGGCDPADVLDCIPSEKRALLIENGSWDEDDRY